MKQIPRPTLDLSIQKQLAKTWQSAGLALEKVRQEELRTMTKAEHLAAFYRVLSFSPPQAQRLNSSLVEYQGKLHRKQG